MKGRKVLMTAAALFGAVKPLDDIPAAYQPRAVAHQPRRVALKPSTSKRAKVKAARKQRQRNG